MSRRSPNDHYLSDDHNVSIVMSAIHREFFRLIEMHKLSDNCHDLAASPCSLTFLYTVF